VGSRRPRLLVVGHDASRSGAPIQARTFLRWLVASSAADVEVVLLAGGPLVDDFSVLGPTTVSRWQPQLVQTLTARAPSPLRASTVRAAVGRLRPAPVDLVLANTLAALPAAIALAGPAPVVCWVHELDRVAERVLPADQRRGLLASVHRWVAAGTRVETMLVDRWGIDPARVHAADPFLDARSPDVAHDEDASAVRIFGVGSMVPRKGVDAFVAAVAIVNGVRGDTPAMWVGGDHRTPYAAQIRTDIDEAALRGTLHLVPEVGDLARHWPHDAVVLHAPREDPAPLVVLEAAMRGLAVVTWDTGGAADLLVRAGCPELVAPAGDVIGIAQRVVGLLDDSSARRRTGDALRRAVASLVAERQAPPLWAAMMAGAAPPPRGGR
jgi:glycosyltransferase involved in cell wall biosynthesis